MVGKLILYVILCYMSSADSPLEGCVDILIIDNNLQIARVYKTPTNEIGMTNQAFKDYVFHYINKRNIRYKRIRFIKCITMIRKEAIDFAVIYRCNLGQGP